MFWPTDEAINKLPQELQYYLNNAVNINDLKKFVLYHVVEQTVVGLSIHSISASTLSFFFYS